MVIAKHQLLRVKKKVLTTFSTAKVPSNAFAIDYLNEKEPGRFIVRGFIIKNVIAYLFKESSPISTLLSNQDIIDTLIEKTSTEIKERLLEQRDALIVSGNIFLVIDYKAAKLFKSP